MLFRDLLKQARIEAGLTQEQLSEATGIPLWTLRKFEQRSPQRVSLDVAYRFAQSLGKTCEYFAVGTDISSDAAATARRPVTKAKRGKGKQT